MERPSPEEYRELILESGLIDQPAWERWSAQTAGQFTRSEEMAEALIAAGLLTRWQSDKLLERKSQGFFLGRYKILRQLGAGSMGAVYLAEHVVMRHRVAIKVMASKYQESTRHVERFEREARATAAVNNRRIVRAFDVEMSGGTPYLVMEYVDGDDLQKIVFDSGVLPIRDAAEYIRQAAEGLEAAHRAGLVHRDIKPSNIMLDHEGEIHILDLGLARMDAGEEASLTMMHNSRALGTVDYLSPEQARDSHSVDARADIYSLGCTLFFLLTGHAPFDEGTIPQRLMAHQSKAPPNLREKRPEVPQDLAAICDKMLAKDRGKRFQTAAEVAAALAEFLAGKTVSAFAGAEEELLKIDLDSGTIEPPAAKEEPAIKEVAAQVAAGARATSVASPLTPIAAPAAEVGIPVGQAAAAEVKPSSSLSSLPPLETPDLFGGTSPPAGSDSLLASFGSDLQALPAETLSDRLSNTQVIERRTLGPAISQLAPTPAYPTFRQTLLDAVSRPAHFKGEGIGGRVYKIWFLILFGILSGLVVAGVGYVVVRTMMPAVPTSTATPAAP